MAILLSDNMRADIRRHAANDYPMECCGAMIGAISNGLKLVNRLHALENVHEEGHERRYLISAESMYRVEKEARQHGLSVLGFYHSHPDHPARPSVYDREWAWPFYSYVILSVERGIPSEMTCWTLDENEEHFVPEEILKNGTEPEE